MLRKFLIDSAAGKTSTALVDADSGEEWSYAQLSAAIQECEAAFRSRGRKLIVVLADNDVGGVVSYLGALASGHAVYLAKADTPLTQEFIDRYQPDYVVAKPALLRKMPADPFRPVHSSFGYDVVRSVRDAGSIGSSTTLLLSTSGSTGSAKLVRLSERNLLAGARQVREALHLRPGERAITSLPFSFVYGLTVLHSHLASGGSLVVSSRSMVDRLFWQSVAQHRVTSLAGVTWTYQTLRQINFKWVQYPSLRTLMHSGSRMDTATHGWLMDLSSTYDRDVVFMYGQTEATGRMCVLPPSQARQKPGAVGWPVPRGQIHCDDDGRITYRGPNVMLGYASSRSDLLDTTPALDALQTGDLGRLDDDGCLYITGRATRICKLLGQRINLDEVEVLLKDVGNVAVKGTDDLLEIFVEGESPPGLHTRIVELAAQIGVPRRTLALRRIDTLPRSSSGKILYQDLRP
jgi:long-chain acyl-CoA synthetase